MVCLVYVGINNNNTEKVLSYGPFYSIQNLEPRNDQSNVPSWPQVADSTTASSDAGSYPWHAYDRGKPLSHRLKHCSVHIYARETKITYESPSASGLNG